MNDMFVVLLFSAYPTVTHDGVRKKKNSFTSHSFTNRLPVLQ